MISLIFNGRLKRDTGAFTGSFENEALEKEDRSTKHPNLENEAPKSRKRRPQNSKTKTPKLENEDPKTRKRTKTKHPKTQKLWRLW